MTRLNINLSHRGHVYHGDVSHDGLLEAEQLCGCTVLQGGESFLHLCGDGSGMFVHTDTQRGGSVVNRGKRCPGLPSVSFTNPICDAPVWMNEVS